MREYIPNGSTYNGKPGKALSRKVEENPAARYIVSGEVKKQCGSPQS